MVANARTSESLPDYAPLQGAYHRAQEPTLRKIIAALPLQPGAQVLDVPCGDGFFSMLLAEHLGEGRVVGADLSPAYLAVANQRSQGTPLADRVAFRKANVYQLPFDEGSFDLVWCAQSLITLSRPIDALREMYRLLRPGGCLAVLEQDEMHDLMLPWPATLEMAVKDACRREFQAHHGDPSPLYVGRRLRQMLREAGFVSVQRETHVTDHQAPLSPSVRQYIDLYMDSLRDRARPFLPVDQRGDFDRLTRPGSPVYLASRPDFEMACVDIVTFGKKPQPRRR